MSNWGIILAAGGGRRLIKTIGRPKQFIEWRGRPLFWASTLTLAGVLDGIVLAFPPDSLEKAGQRMEELQAAEPLGIPYRLVAGGRRRQDSVRLALAALPPEAENVLVHDAARPFIRSPLIRALLNELRQGAKAVIPGVRPKDTIKILAADPALVHDTLPRDSLILVQTPQAFERSLLCRAHELALRDDFEGTDDAALVERLGVEVKVVPGQADNSKITTAEDLRRLAGDDLSMEPCSALGYDVHRFCEATSVQARPLRLGGVLIENGGYVQAHSDGDVLLHALTDALLGGLGLGDIGELFPDSDPVWENVDSALMLGRVLDLAGQRDFKLLTADLTIVCQQPKIAPWRSAIKEKVAHLLGLQPERVSCKATTEEGLGFTGRGQGIKAMVIISGRRNFTPAAE